MPIRSVLARTRGGVKRNVQGAIRRSSTNIRRESASEPDYNALSFISMPNAAQEALSDIDHRPDVLPGQLGSEGVMNAVQYSGGRAASGLLDRPAPQLLMAPDQPMPLINEISDAQLTVMDPEPPTTLDEKPILEPPNAVEPSEFREASSVYSALRQAGLERISARLYYLEEITSGDKEEPNVSFPSLVSLAQFMIANPRRASDRIGLDSNGFLSVSWILNRRVPNFRIPGYTSEGAEFWGNGDGMLVMVFEESGQISFAANSGPPGEGIRRLRRSGIAQRDNVWDELQDFSKWLLLS